MIGARRRYAPNGAPLVTVAHELGGGGMEGGGGRGDWRER